MTPLQKVIAVVGPTATGKTDLGVLIAKHLDTEVISADSRVVYRELNIGTAKPTEVERAGVCHHLIDVADPDEAYSAARYQADASQVLQGLLSIGKIPVVVGGTGFYIRALLQEQFIPPVPPDEAFRDEMTLLAEEKGSEYLHQLLAGKDPERAAVLHPNDRFRLIRALEIIHHTGLPVPKTPTALPYDITWIGLTYQERELLRARIDTRIQSMLAAGWVEEVKRLMDRYGPETEALQVAHGYPELVQVLEGSLGMAEAIEQVKINIHQYARRQLTWFRRNADITWYEVDAMAPGALREKVFLTLPG